MRGVLPAAVGGALTVLALVVPTAPAAVAPSADVTPDTAQAPPPAALPDGVQAVTAPAPAPARELPPASAVASRGDPPVTIVDFAFRNAVTTVDVGDTVTWTNQGPTDHTATAADHSFDTGVLKKGASAGHTFTSAGTFAYICTIHPSMKGTIRVRAAAGAQPSAPRATAPSTPAAPAATGSAPRRSAAAATGGRPQLPATGVAAVVMAAVGLALLAAGLTVRRLAA